MSYYPDLSKGCLGGYGDDVRAIGWLHPEHAYSSGSVGEEFLAKLRQHIDSAWQPFAYCGSHECEFCPSARAARQASSSGKPKQRRSRILHQIWNRLQGRGPTQAEPQETSERVHPMSPRGHRNLYIPTTEAVYIAPEMISHYICAHGYSPPDEFIEAVLASPSQESEAFFSLLARFRADWDPMIFDRAADAKRAAQLARSRNWIRKGMCQTCGQWVYLYDRAEMAEHCGRPLVSMSERNSADQSAPADVRQDARG